MSKQIEEVEEVILKLKRYNELVVKGRHGAKSFNPVINRKELAELNEKAAKQADDDAYELVSLRNYFGGSRVNEAGIELCELLLEELKAASRPRGLLDIFGRRRGK